MPNMQIERKLAAGRGTCLRKSRARLPIPLICGVRLLKKSPAASFANIHKFDKC